MTDNRIHFNTNPKRSPSRDWNTPKQLRRPTQTTRTVVAPEEDYSVRSHMAESIDFSDLKVLTKKRAVKALLHGKVLNTEKKRFRRWKKHDRKVLKEAVSVPLQELINDDKLSYKKAKKVRKIVLKRLLSCFYGKSKKDE